MFGNFLVYIVALLIYSTYEPSQAPDFSAVHSLLLMAGTSVLFIALTWWRFMRFNQRISRYSLARLDDLFQTLMARQSVLALIVYAVDIYFFEISRVFSDIPIIQGLPTLEALILLGLFIFYLSMAWIFGHRSFVRIYRNPVTMKSYVSSNIYFAVPVVLPWLVLSITADLIRILPFEGPRQFLMATEGQILYFMFFLVLIAVIGPLLIQKFWGCRPLRHGLTRFRIESLCRAANMEYRDILIWPLFGGGLITAGVMGLVRRFRYVLVTPGLLKHLEPEELDAVIAHEIGHVKKHHLLFYLFFFAGYLVLTFTVMDLLVYAAVYAEAAWGGFGNTGNHQAAIASIGFSISMIGLFLVYFRYLFGYFMRNFERQADLFACSMMNTAGPLISTFEKITRTSGLSPNRPNWHHFSIAERIGYLKKAEADPRLMDRHHAKIRKSMAAYLVLLSLAGYVGWEIHYRGGGDIISGKVLKAAVSHQMETDKNNPDLHQLLGDIFFNEADFEAAVLAYETAIRLGPDHVRALNNLAWLYATCEDPAFKNPLRALELALRAAALSADAYVLDTLAESYFANGDIRNALTTAGQAMSAAADNHAYYAGQIERFRSAAKSLNPRVAP